MDRKTHSIKVSVLLTLSYGIKSQNNFLAIDKLTVKFIWRTKRPRVANSILKEKNKVRRLMLPNLKTYKAIQDSVVLMKEQTSRSMEQNIEPSCRSPWMI